MIYFLIIVIAAAVLLFIYSWFIEPAQLEVQSHVVDIDPNVLKRPVRILFLSDIHIGQFSRPTVIGKKIERLRKVHRQKPFDFILLGGDFIDRKPRYLPLVERVLQDITAFNLPMYAVLGNHEYMTFGTDPQPLITVLKKCGIQVLRNQYATVQLDGQKLALIGVEDLEQAPDYTRHPQHLSPEEYRKVVRSLDWYSQFDDKGNSLPRILLSHNPDAVYLPGTTKPDLVLAGHTHGGQLIVLDWFGKYLPTIMPAGSFIAWAGRQTIRGVHLIVSRGFEGSATPLRLLRKPDAQIIELQPARYPNNLVIGLSGKPRAGKDTVATILTTLLPGIHRIAFANAIKKEYDAQHGTNTLHDEAQKVKHRPGLQDLGNLRRSEDPLYWIKKVINHAPPILITDVRTPGEVEAIQQAGGYLILVTASEKTLRERLGEYYHEHINHPNERKLDDFKDWHYTVHNNAGLLDLEKQVVEVVKHIVEKD